MLILGSIDSWEFLLSDIVLYRSPTLGYNGDTHDGIRIMVDW